MIRATVVGLGLIGGSLALKLTRAGYEVFGVDVDQSSVHMAYDRGAIVSGGDDAGLCADRDVVIISVPVQSIPRVCADIASVLMDGCTVMDAGSTKMWVVQQMDNILPGGVNVVGGHPMCGSERSGMEAAEEDLFVDQTFCLCPHRGEIDTAVKVVDAVGSNLVILPPDVHDRIVACTSHVPYLTACALSMLVGAYSVHKREVELLVAGGYRDTTRIADCDPIMSRDMVVTNRFEIENRLELLIDELEKIRGLLNDEEKLEHYFRKAQKMRHRVWKKRH